jgi:uncharacterized membrane protein HdeD (DUF308 family)
MALGKSRSYARALRPRAVEGKMAKKEKAQKGRNLAENWKSLILQGAVALVIGVVMVAVPDLTARVVAILLGGFLVVYGVLSFMSASSAAKESQPATWLYVRGGLAVAGGIAILVWPGLKELTLVYMLAVFAIAAGAYIGVSGAFQKWESIYKMVAGIGGALSVIFGIILISSTSSFDNSIVWITGAYAIAFGLLLIILGFGARGIEKSGKQ